MRFLLAVVVAIAAIPAQAQLADQLSRGRAPNALDRALADRPVVDTAAQSAADQARADEARRDVQSTLGPVAGSSMTNGLAGPQGRGSATTSATPVTPNP